MAVDAEKSSQHIAGVRRAESEVYRCGHCQFFTGTGCLLVAGYLNDNEVCDLFSGHRPWQ